MFSFFQKISHREKIFLLGGSSLVGLIVLYLYFIDPAQSKSILLSQLIPKKESEMQSFHALSNEYLLLANGMKSLENRLPQSNQFSLLSYIEKIAEQNQVRDKIVNIRSMTAVLQLPYQEIPMEVKMEAIPLARIISFLATIETAPYYLRIKRLNMKTRYDEPDQLDVTFVVSAYEKVPTVAATSSRGAN